MEPAYEDVEAEEAETTLSISAEARRLYFAASCSEARISRSISSLEWTIVNMNPGLGGEVRLGGGVMITPEEVVVRFVY